MRSVQAGSVHPAGMLSCSVLFLTEETDMKSDLEPTVALPMLFGFKIMFI